jgi:hypothetical protein
MPILALLLAGCAMMGGPATKPSDPVKVDPCAPWKPIYVSKADKLTDGTARQIKDHDETGERLCGWKRNAPAAKAPEPTH